MGRGEGGMPPDPPSKLVAFSHLGLLPQKINPRQNPVDSPTKAVSGCLTLEVLDHFFTVSSFFTSPCCQFLPSPTLKMQFYTVPFFLFFLIPFFMFLWPIPIGFCNQLSLLAVHKLQSSSVPCAKYKCSVKVLKIMLILDLIIEIQTCNERCYVRADTKEGAEEWIRTLRKAAVSLTDMQLCTGQVLNEALLLQLNIGDIDLKQ